MGSPDAVKRTVAELGWEHVRQSTWNVHAAQAPEAWARIAVPRHELRGVLKSLPAGAEWWASPGVGIAHWSIDAGASAVREVRAAAEAARGTLVLMAAPEDLVREAGAWGTPPETLDIMRRLKDAFDPQGILNPGRFVY
jgi:glycolate oxidase FAD binding subunit